VGDRGNLMEWCPLSFSHSFNVLLPFLSREGKSTNSKKVGKIRKGNNGKRERKNE